MPRLLCALFALAALSGCADRYKQDLQDICNAEQRSGASKTVSARDQAVTVANWLVKTLRTDEARNLMSSLADKTPQQQSEALRAEALAHGITACPLADSTAKQGR